MKQKIIMCNNCGGEEITHIKGKNLGICKHCGATIIMPRPDEEIIGLLNTAYLQRANYDFDAAIKTYEYVLDKDSQEKSAYEGLLLAKYGIEYVKDPRSSKLVPTCHRTHFNSIYEDDAYLSLVTLCDEEEKEAVEKRVAEIDKLQKAIAKQLEKEEDFDIFISYKATDENGEKTEDSVIARNIYDKLVEQNYKVFLAEKTLEDRLGSDYEPIIFKAIHTSKMFILVGTKKEYINSVWVKNEWTRFIDRIKNENNGEISSQSFIPVFKDMSPYDMPKVNNKFVQGVDASKLGYNVAVADGISKLLKPKDSKDVLKTFNDFENIVEFKRVQKQAKKEHSKNQIKKLKENKFKYGMFLTLEILCFVLPLVMIGISFTQKFPFLKYCNFWIFLALGLLWIACFVFVLVYKGKTKICQSILRIVLSSICLGIALLFMVLTCISDILYLAVWDMNPSTVDGVYAGGYYYTSWENGNTGKKVVSRIDIKVKDGEDFTIPEYIDGLKVDLDSLYCVGEIDTLYADNKNLLISRIAYGTTINNLKYTGDNLDGLCIQNIGTADICFDVGLLELGAGLSKLNLQNVETLGISIDDNYNNPPQVNEINVETLSRIDMLYRGTIDKLMVLGENEKLEICFGSYDANFPTFTISDLVLRETKNLEISNDASCTKYINISNIRVSKDIESFVVGPNLLFLNNTATIYYEGTEAEWNLVEKTIPAGVTVLFNQSI